MRWDLWPAAFGAGALLVPLVLLCVWLDRREKKREREIQELIPDVFKGMRIMTGLVPVAEEILQKFAAMWAHIGLSSQAYETSRDMLGQREARVRNDLWPNMVELLRKCISSEFDRKDPPKRLVKHPFGCELVILFDFGLDAEVTKIKNRKGIVTGWSVSWPYYYAAAHLFRPNGQYTFTLRKERAVWMNDTKEAKPLPDQVMLELLCELHNELARHIATEQQAGRIPICHHRAQREVEGYVYITTKGMIMPTPDFIQALSAQS